MSPPRTRIKFCGLTRAGDVRLAGELGVDAVGLVFAKGSRRQVSLAEARILRQAAGPFVEVVALFRNNSRSEVREVIAGLRPGLLQFHGEEDETFCAGFQWPWIKAVPMGGGHPVDARDLQRLYPGAHGLLLDSHAAGTSGGSGLAFDWSRVPEGLHRPLVLAGGIGVHNVGEAIAAVQPWAVDVSSGIESAPGIKDGERMQAFVAAVQAADMARRQPVTG